MTTAAGADFESEIERLKQDGTLAPELAQRLLDAHTRDLRSELDRFLNERYRFPEELAFALEEAESLSLFLIEQHGKGERSDERFLRGYRITRRSTIDDQEVLRTLGQGLKSDTVAFGRYEIEVVDHEVVVHHILGGSRGLFRPAIGLRYSCMGEIVEGLFCLKCSEVKFYWDGKLAFSGRIGPALALICERFKNEF